SNSEAQRQVCDDRSNLIAQGFSPSSFAYPYARTNASVEGLVQDCGYAVARKQAGIYDPVECTGCTYANTLPPPDPLNVRGTQGLSRPYTLSDLQGWVTQAEDHSGGWVPLVFHEICDGCAASSVSATDF